MAGSRLIHRITLIISPHHFIIFPNNFPTLFYDFPMLFVLPDLGAILGNLQQTCFWLLQCRNNHLLILGEEGFSHQKDEELLHFSRTFQCVTLDRSDSLLNFNMVSMVTCTIAVNLVVEDQHQNSPIHRLTWSPPEGTCPRAGWSLQNNTPP